MSKQHLQQTLFLPNDERLITMIPVSKMPRKTNLKKRSSLLCSVSLGKERALVVDQDIRDWFSGMKEYLDSCDLTLLKSSNRIFNADEAGFAFAPVSKSPGPYRHEAPV
ncbi:hypothetical protein RRG08_024006 [Elysia crispata]|uniref:Uncharacterized protein n=1 Tax=Elysia crispata TaxID=231223 RepID=A0AAE0YNB3_9GAST|nr:hypothetical protein RRG08_024006 [Elysia crispata]